MMEIEELRELKSKFFDLGNTHENRDIGVIFHGAASCLMIIIKTLEGTEEDPIVALTRFYSDAAHNMQMMAVLKASGVLGSDD
jgi:hypothetical protein